MIWSLGWGLNKTQLEVYKAGATPGFRIEDIWTVCEYLSRNYRLCTLGHGAAKCAVQNSALLPPISCSQKPRTFCPSLFSASPQILQAAIIIPFIFLLTGVIKQATMEVYKDQKQAVYSAFLLLTLTTLL
jgi:hypothetical protein